MQNPIPYPCKECPRNDRPCEHSKCKRYKEWLRVEWRLACEPFRRIKREQDEQRGNK